MTDPQDLGKYYKERASLSLPLLGQYWKVRSASPTALWLPQSKALRCSKRDTSTVEGRPGEQEKNMPLVTLFCPPNPAVLEANPTQYFSVITNESIDHLSQFALGSLTRNHKNPNKASSWLWEENQATYLKKC